ncbi:MAG: OOP family OmpA-OmpF porin [Candidatus Accumulibacter regalis]
MKRIARTSTIVAAFAAALGFGASLAQAQTSIPLDRVYVIDSRGEVAMSGAGLCWRTGFWTPAGAAKDPAGCKCDKDLLPKEVCEPPMAKAAAATAKPYQKLSERRAASVKAYLVSKGVEANRVYTEGKGEKQPVTKPGQCPGGKSAKVIECLQPDRRVDIELIGTK